MKRYIFLIICILTLLVGCSEEKLKDNQVYIVDEEQQKAKGENLQKDVLTEGIIPFKEYEDSTEDLYGQVLLTISPDNNYMYYMEYNQNIKNNIIKGSTKQSVRLVKVNKKTKEKKVISENIPFISSVKWNIDGTMVAFCGEERLTIYDDKKNKLILEDKLKNDRVNYFFWSPKEKYKLYSEQPSLANGAIYYTESLKKVEAYETKEEIYFKGTLDNQYYYATKWFVQGERKNDLKIKNEGLNTVIVDKQGNIIKVLAEGSFRDAYKKSLVQVGENGFGLYYLKDINTPEDIETLTDEYVYDVKFVGDGKIVYIVDSDDLEKNSFNLNIVNSKGRTLEKLEVSGSSIAVAPNGKIGYIGGPLQEKIDFENNEIQTKLPGFSNDDKLELAKRDIFQNIRGAMDTFYKFEMTGEKDFNGLKKYFVDTYAPEQWAYFDIKTKFNESTDPSAENNEVHYTKNIEVIDEDIDLEKNRASIVITGEAKEKNGRKVTIENALELIKLEDTWYLTGFSTFPFTEERMLVKTEIEKFIIEAKNGNIFPGILEGSEVSIGQIQFWRSNMPQLALDADNGNYCKVYLIVKKDKKQEIYKLVLDKKNDNWKPIKLEKDNLSYL